MIIEWDDPIAGKGSFELPAFLDKVFEGAPGGVIEGTGDIASELHKAFVIILSVSIVSGDSKPLFRLLTLVQELSKASIPNGLKVCLDRLAQRPDDAEMEDMLEKARKLAATPRTPPDDTKP